MLLISGFLLLSFSGVQIDIKKRKIKSYNSFFGFIKTGKWKPIDKYMGVTLVRMRKVYNLYSRSNRINSSKIKEFRIYFVDRAKKPAVAIKICKTNEDAQNSLDEFAIWLKLPVYSVPN